MELRSMNTTHLFNCQLVHVLRHIVHRMDSTSQKGKPRLGPRALGLSIVKRVASRARQNKQTHHDSTTHSPQKLPHTQIRTSTPHIMDASHRKIELQSPSDLTYLTSLLRTAALAKLNLHQPPDSASEPDDLRRQVEDLVDAFVAQILAGMRGNISINGMEIEPEGNEDERESGKEGVVEEYEPFDEKLRSRVGAMIARRDALVGKISEHRRGTAGVAAQKWREGWERESATLLAEQEQMEGVQVADVVELERREEVERNFEKAVMGLKRLEGGLPETRARLERAGTVVGYVAGEGK